MDWRIPLVVAAALFAVVLVVRTRPRFGGAERPSQAIRDAKEALGRATTDEARAAALAAAGDAYAALVGRGGSAVSFYLRAFRIQPTSLALVDRASLALARKPFALESFLWGCLATEYVDGMRPVVQDVVRRLQAVHDKPPLRRRLRARAFATLSRALASP